MGGDFKMIAVVSKLSKKFTYFYHNGTPARARVSLILKPYKTTKQIVAETKKQSSDLTKQRITKSGDNIWLLADREYEDPRCWRDIAKANDIDDPRSVEMGRNLTLAPRREDG
jgi:nucleoid-associated protein YgaU